MRRTTARNRPGRVIALSTAALMASVACATAADVSYERLRNPEPQNWLMNHRDYGAQRFSPLDTINASNVKNLKLAFSISLGGKSADEYLEQTPLVEDGFMYTVDSWGVVSKFDVRSGPGAKLVWRMDPKLEKQDLTVKPVGKPGAGNRHARSAIAASRCGTISSSRSAASSAA